MSYGHAHELLANGAKSPAAELRAAVRKLKTWADLNPRLQPLYLDFDACLRDLDEYLAEDAKSRPAVITLWPELRQRLVERAIRHERSVSSEASMLISEGLEAHNE